MRKIIVIIFCSILFHFEILGEKYFVQFPKTNVEDFVGTPIVEKFLLFHNNKTYNCEIKNIKNKEYYSFEVDFDLKNKRLFFFTPKLNYFYLDMANKDQIENKSINDSIIYRLISIDSLSEQKAFRLQIEESLKNKKNKINEINIDEPDAITELVGPPKRFLVKIFFVDDTGSLTIMKGEEVYILSVSQLKIDGNYRILEYDSVFPDKVTSNKATSNKATSNKSQTTRQDYNKSKSVNNVSETKRIIGFYEFPNEIKTISVVDSNQVVGNNDFIYFSIPDPGYEPIKIRFFYTNNEEFSTSETIKKGKGNVLINTNELLKKSKPKSVKIAFDLPESHKTLLKRININGTPYYLNNNNTIDYKLGSKILDIKIEGDFFKANPKKVDIDNITPNKDEYKIFLKDWCIDIYEVILEKDDYYKKFQFEVEKSLLFENSNKRRFLAKSKEEEFMDGLKNVGTEYAKIEKTIESYKMKVNIKRITKEIPIEIDFGVLPKLKPDSIELKYESMHEAIKMKYPKNEKLTLYKVPAVEKISISFQIPAKGIGMKCKECSIDKSNLIYKKDIYYDASKIPISLTFDSLPKIPVVYFDGSKDRNTKTIEKITNEILQEYKDDNVTSFCIIYYYNKENYVSIIPSIKKEDYEKSIKNQFVATTKNINLSNNNFNIKDNAENTYKEIEKQVKFLSMKYPIHNFDIRLYCTSSTYNYLNAVEVKNEFKYIIY
jgi:hypothetical protein